MHVKLLHWLNGPSTKEGKTNLKYLAELIAVNGGSIDIGRVGAIKNESVWGRTGLTPNEALDLTSMVHFSWGIMFAIEKDLRGELQEVVQIEINRQQSGMTIHVPNSSEVSAFSKPFTRTK